MSAEKYPLSAAAAKVENFEAMNEGIWVTAEALDNIEASIAEHQRNLQQAAHAVETGVSAIEGLNTTVAERDATIAAQTEQIAALQSELAALKAGPAGNLSGTTTTQDELGADGVIGSDPVNAEAARLRAMRNK